MENEMIELFKLRIEDCARERESLRGLEWRFFFETLAAYAAIAYAYLKIQEKLVGSCHPVLLTLGIVATLIVSFSGWFLLRHAHIRMHVVATLKYDYFKKMHEATGLPILEIGKTKPWYWAILPQYLTLGSMATGLIGWMTWLASMGK